MESRIVIRTLALAAVTFLCAATVRAQTNAIATGNWSDPLTWSAGEPTTSLPATIDGGRTVTIDQSGETTNSLDLGTASGSTGNLKINGGDLFITDPDTVTPPNIPSIRLGQAAGSTGTLTMTAGNVFIDGPSPSDVAIGELIVGDNGTGVFTMSGGDFETNDELWIGIQAGSTGTASVSGGTLKANGRSILVGFNGNGNLNVSGTGAVRANFDMLVGFNQGTPAASTTNSISLSGGTIDSNFLFTNFAAGPVGSVVNMTQTSGTWTAHLAFVMGQGPGTTTFTHSGGTVNSTTELGNGDFVVSDGAGNTTTYNISGSATTNVGRDFIVGTFEGANGTINQSGGTVNITNNARIGADGTGHWNVTGGTLNGKNVFLGDFDSSFGTLKITTGTVTLTGDLSVGGALASNAAPDRVEPDGTNGAQGQALGAHGTLIVSGSGASINVAGNFLANPSDKSSFRRDPFAPGGDNSANLTFQILNSSGTSLINTAGIADLDGSIVDVALLGGYLPTVGATFDLLKASAFGSTGTGTTQNVGTGVGFTLAAEDSGVFSVAVVTSGTSKILRATYLGGTTGVAGDYNGNGVVDAADYVLWRAGGPLQNDPTPGVQAADYTFWRSRFGATSGAGSSLGGASAVPEPTSLILFIAGALVGLGQRSRRIWG